MTLEFQGTVQRKPAMASLSAAAVGALVLLSACSPTVKVQAPDKPIVINLNVKIEQEVRIRVEKEVEELFSENPDIF